LEDRLGVEALKSDRYTDELFVVLPGIMLKYIFFPYSWAWRLQP